MVLATARWAVTPGSGSVRAASDPVKRSAIAALRPVHQRGFRVATSGPMPYDRVSGRPHAAAWRHRRQRFCHRPSAWWPQVQFLLHARRGRICLDASSPPAMQASGLRCRSAVRRDEHLIDRESRSEQRTV